MRRKVVLFTASLVFVGSQSTFGLQQTRKGGGENSPSPGIGVKTSFVCMVDNRYKGKEQIRVEVDGKAYYGCCKGCVSAIENDRTIRFAHDPLTSEEVDKANAYIVLNPDKSGKVLYFESPENYLEWEQTLKKDRDTGAPPRDRKDGKDRIPSDQ